MSGRRGRNPFGAGTVFQWIMMWITFLGRESQSLWSRDGFSIELGDKYARFHTSQSLWSRDGFSMNQLQVESTIKRRNPFGAGTVFQWENLYPYRLGRSRNPFGAGTVFQYRCEFCKNTFYVSQSLWSRDGFSMNDDNPLRMQARSQSLWGRDGFSIDCLARRHPV